MRILSVAAHGVKRMLGVPQQAITISRFFVAKTFGPTGVRMRSPLRFSHAGTNEAFALPALKRSFPRINAGAATLKNSNRIEQRARTTG